MAGRPAVTVSNVNSYLLVLGEREAIGWVLHEQRMAFPATRRPELDRLAIGDQLFVYATRGAWRNPSRDRGRIIAIAAVASLVHRFDLPIEVAGREFHSGCRIRIDRIVPYPGGVELQPLVGRMNAFPKPESWSVYLRRTLLPLPGEDAAVVSGAVEPLLRPRRDALRTYDTATQKSSP